MDWQRRKVMRRQLLWVVVALASCCPLAQAQETTTGSITGTVVDAQGAAVPGVTITINSERETKTYVTDANGHYFAPYLVPGTYSVRAELPGFTSVEERGIEVRLGMRLEVPFTLKLAGINEAVTVVSEAPVVDTTSTTTGSNLLTDVLERLPVARNFTATLYLVPGVSDSGNAGAANPSIGGASGLDNAYIVDGVNITDEGFGVGAFSYVYGSLGSGVTTDFIKETQVKTGGFEAEYGMATGGVVNVVSSRRITPSTSPHSATPPSATTARRARRRSSETPPTPSAPSTSEATTRA
jgi:Carboxypeptidase regulatory-like domain/TonB-dependent Receptor Plug Domain